MSASSRARWKRAAKRTGRFFSARENKTASSMAAFAVPDEVAESTGFVHPETAHTFFPDRSAYAEMRDQIRFFAGLLFLVRLLHWATR